MGDLDTITALRTVRWAAQPSVVWVLIETTAGITGLGETYYLPGAVEADVHDMAAPLLLGQAAGSIAAHAHTLFSCANFSGFAGAEMRAFSAIDMALWDALGRRLDAPVHQLLGGTSRIGSRSIPPAFSPALTTTVTSSPNLQRLPATCGTAARSG